MRKKLVLVLLTMLALLSAPPVHRASALGGVTLTAPQKSNVSIDGTLQSAEWSDGTHLSFNWAANNASLTGGGDVWVKTNGTDLLLAVGANGRTSTNAGTDTYNYTLALLFDNDNNGVINNNDDAKSLGISFFSTGSSTETYRDLHYDSARGSYLNDAYVNGTAAGSHSNPGGSGGWSWEFATPMKSNLAEDFTLAENASIGFEIVYAEQHYRSLSLVSSGWAYWEVSYPNGLPTSADLSANGWATIVRTNLKAPISDTTPPTISTPIIKPASPSSSDTVTVSVNVTDTGSGVKNASITYTIDNWKSTNKTVTAAYNITTHLAMAQIPAHQSGGQVAYYIVAYDNAGNKALNNNSEPYFGYDVSPPLYLNLWFYVVLALLAIIIIFAIVYPKRHRRSNNPT